MEMDVEIDEQKVIDSLDADEVLRKSGMNASDCTDFFGDKLLAEFTIADIIAYHGADSFLDEIGEEAVIKHFNIDVAE